MRDAYLYMLNLVNFSPLNNVNSSFHYEIETISYLLYL